jgi:hypothetical protein
MLRRFEHLGYLPPPKLSHRNAPLRGRLIDTACLAAESNLHPANDKLNDISGQSNKLNIDRSGLSEGSTSRNQVWMSAAPSQKRRKVSNGDPNES